MARRRPTGRPPKSISISLGTFLPAQAHFWKALDEGKRFVAYIGGVRGGKTWIGARRAMWEAVRRGGLGWIVAPTFPMAGIPKREFEDVLGQHPALSAQHHDHPQPYWRLSTTKGPEIEIRSAENPDRLRGPGLSWVWIDEAALMDYEAWRILQGRVLDTRGVIFLTTTPKGRNWLWEEFVARGGPEYAVVASRTADNVFLPADALERLQERWGEGTGWARQELGAEFVAFEGLMYPDFDAAVHVTVPPKEGFIEVMAGLDWGYNDPTVCLVMGRDRSQNWWVLDEYYEPEKTGSEVARDIGGFLRKWNIRKVWADSKRPDLIREVALSGIPVLAAKPCTPITLGCARVAALLRQGRLKISPTCRWTIAEFGLYSMKRQPGTDRAKGGEVPEDRHNHCMDTLRYVIWSVEPPQREEVRPALIRIPQPAWRL